MYKVKLKRKQKPAGKAPCQFCKHKFGLQGLKRHEASCPSNPVVMVMGPEITDKMLRKAEDREEERRKGAGTYETLEQRQKRIAADAIGPGFRQLMDAHRVSDRLNIALGRLGPSSYMKYESNLRLIGLLTVMEKQSEGRLDLQSVIDPLIKHCDPEHMYAILFGSTK